MRSAKELALSYVRSGRRRLGQHFLTDPSVLDRIVLEVAALRPQIIVEIGVGFGVLTERFSSVAGRVIGVEKDRRLFRMARRRLRRVHGLHLILGDALKVEIPGDAVAAGSPPYSISTELVKKLIFGQTEWWVLLFQREFYEKLASSPEASDRSYLSALAAIAGETSLLMDVSRLSFYPPPEVDSALVRFHFTNPHGLTADGFRALSHFLSTLFRDHRHRKARGALRSLGEGALAAPENWGERRVFELTSRELLEMFSLVRGPA
ncbi:MAG: ribosomal RNA small subunit methyltransferase A [Candidatus Geothermarchaeales archaeon]